MEKKMVVWFREKKKEVKQEVKKMFVVVGFPPQQMVAKG